MSIITTFIYHTRAFVFSEGRLTTHTTIDRDDFDKTMSLVSGRLICCFAGRIIVNTNSGGITDVRKILTGIEAGFDVDSLDEFINASNTAIQAHLQHTQRGSHRRVNIHYTKRLPDGRFEVKCFAIESDPADNDSIRINPQAEAATDDFFRIDGDNSGAPATGNYLRHNGFDDSADGIIAHNKVATAIGCKASDKNGGGLLMSGGCFYYKSL